MRGLGQPRRPRTHQPTAEPSQAPREVPLGGLAWDEGRGRSSGRAAERAPRERTPWKAENARLATSRSESRTAGGRILAEREADASDAEFAQLGDLEGNAAVLARDGDRRFVLRSRIDEHCGWARGARRKFDLDANSA